MKEKSAEGILKIFEQTVQKYTKNNWILKSTNHESSKTRTRVGVNIK